MRANVRLTINEQTVVVTGRHSSHATTANILGREIRDGVECIYLDALIHIEGDDALDGWRVNGAISTVLSRP